MLEMFVYTTKVTCLSESSTSIIQTNAWCQANDRWYCNVIALYRSSSQSQDQLESFKEKFELNLESAVQNNSFLVVFLGNFPKSNPKISTCVRMT